MSSSLTLNESQWNTVMQTVHDEAMRARVAASFLPLFGPLDGDVQAVPKNILSVSKSNHLEVNDYETMRLATLSVNVLLGNSQLADPELTSALIMFRRAAEIMARVEDTVIFNGQTGGDQAAPNKLDLLDGVPAVWKLTGGVASVGLIAEGVGNGVDFETGKQAWEFGQNVFSAIVQAITKIEGAGHHGPFACVLGDDLFTAINTPMPNSMVLPRDGILPFLDAPLLRSSAVPANEGVIVSLRGAPAEIVVPSDITVRHITTTPEAKHVFRVQQKFILRVKDNQAIAKITAT
jgi:uncharacterized linocin/CFP29 family protein